MSLSQTDIVKGNYILRNVQAPMTCLTLGNLKNGSIVQVQGVDCNSIKAPDSWSFNVTEDNKYTIQWVDSGAYMISDFANGTAGSFVIGALSSMGTASLWELKPSNNSYGFGIFVGNSSVVDPTQSITLFFSANTSTATPALEKYTGQTSQDWILQNFEDIINQNLN